MPLAIISKLPTDMFDIMHILPFWFTYLLWFLWIAGIALVLCLLIYLISRFLKYLQTLPSQEHQSDLVRNTPFGRAELQKNLKIILDNAVKSMEFRLGLHRMSAVLKTYFEILLKLEIEEMTAKEIKQHVKDKKALGDFFTELTVAQYRIDDPDKEEFLRHYNKALRLIV